MHEEAGEQDADGSEFSQAYGTGSDGVEGWDGSEMMTPEENEQQWQRVADAENPGMAELRRELESAIRTIEQEQAIAVQKQQECDRLTAQLAESQSRATHWAAKATEEAGENKPLRDQIQQLTADFDRRTDILNNHIAREKVLEDESAAASIKLANLTADLRVFENTANSIWRNQQMSTQAVASGLLDLIIKFADHALVQIEAALGMKPVDTKQARAAKEPTATACNCAGCNPANYPETNGWKCGMHAAKEPTA